MNKSEVFAIYVASEMSNIVISRFANEIPLSPLCFYKYAIAQLLISIFVHTNGPSVIPFKKLLRMSFISIPGGIILSALIILASQNTSASHVSCIFGFLPIIMMIVESKSFKRIGWKAITSIIFILCSNLLVLGSECSNGKLIGDIYAVIGVCLLAWFIFGLKYFTTDFSEKEIPVAIIQSNIIIGAAKLMLTGEGNYLNPWKLISNPKLGLFSALYGLYSVISCVMTSKAVKVLPGYLISMGTLLGPSMAQTLLSVLGYETITLKSVTAQVLIVAGVVLCSLDEKEKQKINGKN